MCASSDRRRRQRRLRLGREGAAAVEFALLFPLLALVLYALMELARALWSWNSLQLMADEASRWASVRPAATAGEVEAVARSYAGGLDLAGLTVAVDTAATGPGGQRTVDVVLGYDFRLAAPGLVSASPLVTMQARSRMPVLEY